jgi:hypothetical protein
MSFLKELHRIENKLFGNKVIKYTDPGAYYINKETQKYGNAHAKWWWPEDVVQAPESQAATEDANAAAASAKKKRQGSARRQGVGPGSTLLTGGEDSTTLGSNSDLGNG